MLWYTSKLPKEDPDFTNKKEILNVAKWQWDSKYAVWNKAITKTEAASMIDKGFDIKESL